MTTTWQCPAHGTMKPGQVVHDGRQYSCSSCGRRLQAVAEDAGSAMIRQLENTVARLQAENAALRSRPLNQHPDFMEYKTAVDLIINELQTENNEQRRQLAMMIGA